jgi:hypothetical protein
MTGSDDFFVKGLAGQPMPVADGAEATSRFSRMSGLVTGNLNDFLYESTFRGNRFAMQLPVTTTGIAAGNIDNASAAASTNFALWNPTGSGKALSLSKFFMSLTSGTVPAGPINHSFGTAPSIASTLTNGTQNSLLIGPAPGPVAKGVAAAAGTTLTGGGALTRLRPSPFFFTAGTGADLAGQFFEEDIFGDIVVLPGFMWVPTWSGAGTSVLSGYGVTWEEIPL